MGEPLMFHLGKKALRTILHTMIIIECSDTMRDMTAKKRRDSGEM